MLKIFKKKSYNLFSQLINRGGFYQANSSVIDLYLRASPLFIATNMVASSVADINFIIYDKKKDKIIYEHELLTLLNKPNPFTEKKLFINQLVSNYLLTGNIYVVKYMSSRAMPIELMSINPQDITIQSSSQDDYAGSYTITNNFNKQNGTVFNRNDKYKFVAKNENELIHCINYNPNYGNSNLVGTSFFAGAAIELSMYLEANLLNYNFIKNGANPSAIINYDGDNPLMLDPDTAEKVKNKLENTFKGANNAGSVVFLSDKYKIQTLGSQVKDLNYAELQARVDKKVFQCLQIPIAKIENKAMTYSNLDVAEYQYYDNAVLPIFNKIADFLTTKILQVDYKNSQDLVLTYDEAEIKPLKTRQADYVKTIYKDGIITRNEARTELGYEASQNGDLFYGSNLAVPNGNDNYTDDNRDAPAKKELRILMEQRGYTKQEIDEAVDGI